MYLHYSIYHKAEYENSLLKSQIWIVAFSHKVNDISGIMYYKNTKRYTMSKNYLAISIKKRKEELGWTIEKISRESGIGIRTVNRILAGKDVRFSSIESVIKALGLSLMVDRKLSA